MLESSISISKMRSLSLAIMLAFSLTGCGGGDSDSDDTESVTEEVVEDTQSLVQTPIATRMTVLAMRL